jgi:hypothetical protein
LSPRFCHHSCQMLCRCFVAMFLSPFLPAALLLTCRAVLRSLCVCCMSVCTSACIPARKQKNNTCTHAYKRCTTSRRNMSGCMAVVVHT